MTTASDRYDEDAMAATLAFCDEVGRAISIAHTLLTSGQQVDLNGLDDGISLLCAKSLDLPPAMGRALRPHLTAVLNALEDLAIALDRQTAA